MTAEERKIAEAYKRVFKKIYTKRRLNKFLKGDRFDIISASAALENSRDYDEFAKKFSRELAKLGLTKKRGIWRKYYEAAKKLNYIALPKTWSDFEKRQMEKAILHNFKMIKTIPRHVLEISQHKYSLDLINEVAKGRLSRGTFYRDLAAHGAKNAKVIARTESSKLLTFITENRAKDLGSVAYRWRSSNDIRTRPSHRAMNNVIVFWRPDNEKPILDKMQGNAGEFPNCRCTAQAIFDEDDFPDNHYKVYDYRTHKVVTMKTKDLLEAMKKGQL